MFDLESAYLAIVEKRQRRASAKARRVDRRAARRARRAEMLAALAWGVEA